MLDRWWSACVIGCTVALAAGLSCAGEPVPPPATVAAAPPDVTIPFAPSPLAAETKPIFPAGANLGRRGGASAHPAAIAKPVAAAPTQSFTDLLAMLGPLALVVGLIVLSAAVLRRAAGSSANTLAAALGPGGKAPTGVLDVLGRFPIARGQTLVLLRMDRRVLLLAHALPTRHSAGGFTTLAEITDPDEIAGLLIKARDARGESVATQFAEVVARMERGDLGEREVHDQRRVHSSAHGDSTSLWRDDPTAIPPFAAHTPVPTLAANVQHAPRSDAHGGFHAAPDAHGIKARLAALRGRADRGRPAGSAA